MLGQSIFGENIYGAKSDEKRPSLPKKRLKMLFAANELRTF